MSNTDNKSEKPRRIGLGGIGAILSEKEKKTLLSHLAVGICIVELFVTIIAIVHGVTNMHPASDGTMSYNFPWKEYILSIFLAPIGIMFLIQLVGMGLSHIMMGDQELNDAASDAVPERLKKWVNLVQGMPTMIILAGMLLLGALVYHLDVIMNSIVQLGQSFLELAIWIGVGLFAVWLISYLARMWLMYKTHRLQEEFAFRREVLEKTGIAIVDKKTIVTPDGKMLTANGKFGRNDIKALPVVDIESTPKELPQAPVNPSSDDPITDEPTPQE